MSKKKTKETATPNQGIGFGKGVRVGNFRLYKIRKGVGSKETIEALTIGFIGPNLERITIPSTMPIIFSS